jgi:hypothetical protein
MTTSRVHQHRTQAEDVARRPDVMTQGLLRRQEPGRAEVLTRQRVILGARCDPEVDQPRPVLGQQDGRRTEVPVHHARGMQRAQAFRQPGRQRQHLIGGQRPVGADLISQRRPVDVRRGQPRHRTVQVRVQHGRHEGSAHLLGRGHLGPEPGIYRHVGWDDHQRDAFPVRRTAQEQATTAQLPQQFVRPDRARLVRFQRHCHPDPTHPSWRLEPFLPMCQVMLSYGAGCTSVHARAVPAPDATVPAPDATVPAPDATVPAPDATAAGPRSCWPPAHFPAPRDDS